MQLVTARQDLESALNIATIAMSGSGDDLSSHYLFRIKNGGAEILTYNGQRIFAGTPLKCNHEGEDGDAFTVAGWRLNQWVSVAPDEAITLEFDPEAAVVKVSSPSSPEQRFPSQDPEKFPYWDEVAATSSSTATISADRLCSALKYAKLFVSDQDTKEAHIAATEAKDGSLWATDKGSLTQVKLAGFDDAKIRVHGKDLPSVLTFLQGKDLGDVEVLEHERCMLLRRADGSLLGVSRWLYAFPDLPGLPEEGESGYWVVSANEFQRTVTSLLASAKKDARRIQFAFNADTGKVDLSVDADTGGECKRALDVIEHTDAEGISTPFWLDYRYVFRVAGHFSDHDTLKFYIQRMKKNGFCRFIYNVDGDEYTTIVVWLRKV